MEGTLEFKRLDSLFAFQRWDGVMFFLTAPDEETAKTKAHLSSQWTLLGEILVLPPGWRDKAEDFLKSTPDGQVALGIIKGVDKHASNR